MQDIMNNDLEIDITFKEIGIGQSQRNQKTDQREAFQNVINNPKFKLWLHRKIYEKGEEYKKDQEEIERLVDKAMESKNLKIEEV